jgi:hypothetical protein
VLSVGLAVIAGVRRYVDLGKPPAVEAFDMAACRSALQAGRPVVVVNLQVAGGISRSSRMHRWLSDRPMATALRQRNACVLKLTFGTHPQIATHFWKTLKWPTDQEPVPDVTIIQDLSWRYVAVDVFGNEASEEQTIAALMQR